MITSYIGLSDSENNTYHDSKNCDIHNCEYYHDSGLTIHQYYDYKQKDKVVKYCPWS